MTTTVMDSSYLEQLYQPKDFTVTPEKLEELKEKVPKAGPKFRLGMYFETIHDLPEFDTVATQDDGYTSCWETDTELDSEYGNFIFSGVTGDSASVICLEEAMDLLALREEQKQHGYLDPNNQYGSPEDDIDHPFEQSAEGKRSTASRHSHHSGSDGTYDGSAQVVPGIPERPSSAEDHIYETLDDCREDYHAHVEGPFATKVPNGSRGTDNNWREENDSSGKRDVASHSPSHRRLKPRSVSLPQPPEELVRLHGHGHQRNLSDTSNHRRKQLERVAPKPGQLPIRGYTFPNGVPSDYAEYMSAAGVPPSPEKKSHNSGGSTKKSRQPSLIIKHKGQTFIIPVVDKKKAKTSSQAKQRASQVFPSYDTTPKHTTLNTLPRSSAGSCSTPHPTAVPVSRRHTSPPKVESSEPIASLQRRRSRQPSQSSISPAQSKHVIHYGVL